MNSFTSYSVTPESILSPIYRNASCTITLSFSAAYTCDSNCSAFQRCVAYWSRSADGTISTPRLFTSSSVPPSTFDTRGSAPSGVYSIATLTRPVPSSRRNSAMAAASPARASPDARSKTAPPDDIPTISPSFSIMSLRLMNSVVSRSKWSNRLWSTKLSSRRGLPLAGIHSHTGRVTCPTLPTVSANIGFSPR